MASLTGQTIASTYDALLKITDNGPITASLKQITDGLGNNTPLYLSATTVYVNGAFRVSGAFFDANNEPGSAGQFLVSTGVGVDWQNISESGLISGSGTNGFISKFTAGGVIANSVIQESSSNIGIGISPTQKLHVSGNGLFTGTITASNVSGSTSGSNTGDETNASIKTKLGAATAVNDGYLTAVDYELFTNKVPLARTITINGETYDLSANRTYSVNVGVTSFNTRTGAVVLSSGDVTTALGYTPALESRIMTINGVGYSLAADRSWSVGTVTSVGTSAPLTGGTITGAGTIGITQSGASTDGYLSSTDWNTFNNKQDALGFTPENVANKGIANGYASLDGAGKVPSTQLPSYVDDVVEVANFAALPATGETGKIYITLDTNFVYRWSGSVYVKISEPNAVWGSITGTLSNQTDLQSALNAKVDNTRTLTINGVTSDLSANRTFNVGTVTNVSGTGSVSGLSLSGSVTGSGSLTLGGTLSLTSSDITTGLGYTPVTNARTLSINGTAFDLTANRSWNVGTVTSVGLELGTTGTDANISNSPITSSGNITLNLPTASASNRGLLSSTDWSTFNAKQNALTLTTTGNSGSATLVGSTLNIPTYTLAGLGGQPLLTNPVTGTGTSGYLTRFTGSTTVGNSVIFDNGSQIGIGTTSPTERLHVIGRGIFGTTGAGSYGLLITDNDQSNVRLRLTNTGGGGQTFSIVGGNPGVSNAGLAIFDETNSATRMYVSSGGNVGIGLSNPAFKLHIQGADLGSVVDSTSSSGSAFVSAYSSVDGNAMQMRAYGNSTGGTIFGSSTNRMNAIWSNGDSIYALGTISTTPMIFGTSNTERMRITSGGNVGIGLSNPTSRLDVSTTEFNVSKFFSSNTLGQIWVGQSLNANRALAIGYDSSSEYGYINVFGQSAGSTLNFKGSNVGIGTSAPATRTHFVGGSTTTSAANAATTVTSRFDVANPAVSLGIGYVSTDMPMIQAFNNGTGNSSNLIINPFGGAIGIGNTNPTHRFVIGDGSGTGNQYLRIWSSASDIFIGQSGSGLFGMAANSGQYVVADGVSHPMGIGTIAAQPVIFGTQNTEKMRITSGGEVYIATSSFNGTAGIRLMEGNQGVISTTRTTTDPATQMRFYNPNGQVGGIVTSGSSTAFNTSSDYRLKEDLKEINGLDKVSKLKVYDFKWKASDERMDGVMAHELAEVLPYAVTGEKDGEEMQGVDYSKLVPILVKAIQEQQAQIEELKAKLK